MIAGLAVSAGCGSTDHKPAPAAETFADTDKGPSGDMSEGPRIAALRIPSEGMEPTLHVGDIIVFDLRAYDRRPPQVGDVVVFHPPTGADENRCGHMPISGQACSLPTKRRTGQRFTKRIVAGPGDRLRIRGGRVLRNGKRQREPFARPCQREGCDFPKEIVIPQGMYFMMGDNRSASDDSRFWGPVPKTWILGKEVPSR